MSAPTRGRVLRISDGLRRRRRGRRVRRLESEAATSFRVALSPSPARDDVSGSEVFARPVPRLPAVNFAHGGPLVAEGGPAARHRRGAVPRAPARDGPRENTRFEAGVRLSRAVRCAPPHNASASDEPHAHEHAAPSFLCVSAALKRASPTTSFTLHQRRIKRLHRTRRTWAISRTCRRGSCGRRENRPCCGSLTRHCVSTHILLLRARTPAQHKTQSRTTSYAHSCVWCPRVSRR